MIEHYIHNTCPTSQLIKIIKFVSADSAAVYASFANNATDSDERESLTEGELHNEFQGDGRSIIACQLIALCAWQPAMV